MASTRNKNTQGNYDLEMRAHRAFEDNILYENSAWGVTAGSTYLPGDGVYNTKIPYTQLSHNGVDIESFLRGTHSTDLDNPAASAMHLPELKYMKSLNIYKKPEMVLPVPLVVEKNQRPKILGL